MLDDDWNGVEEAAKKIKRKQVLSDGSHQIIPASLKNEQGSSFQDWEV